MSKFKKYTNKNLTDGCKLDSDTFVTPIKDMTLNEYSVTVKSNCENLHNVKGCSKCKPVEAIAEICEKGIVPLLTLYRQCVNKSDKNFMLLCEMASHEKDKRLIRVALCQKTSGNEAKRLGVSVLNKEKMKVYEAMEDYLEIKQHWVRLHNVEMESSEESRDEISSGQSCIWISDDEKDEEQFVEQDMLDGQKMLTLMEYTYLLKNIL